jgi:hypothetical protein
MCDAAQEWAQDDESVSQRLRSPLEWEIAMFFMLLAMPFQRKSALIPHPRAKNTKAM